MQAEWIEKLEGIADIGKEVHSPEQFEGVAADVDACARIIITEPIIIKTCFGIGVLTGKSVRRDVNAVTCCCEVAEKVDASKSEDLAISIKAPNGHLEVVRDEVPGLSVYKTSHR
jgi:hypothetical protein